MKKFNFLYLLIISMFFTITIFDMEAVSPEKKTILTDGPYYPFPNIDLTISNETKDNFVLMIDNTILTGIKAEDIKKNIKIPIKHLSSSFFPDADLINSNFAPDSRLILVNLNTQQRYLFTSTVLKFIPHILFNMSLKELAMSKKQQEKILMSESKKIENENIKTTQDTYKIDLTLKGEDLTESEIDYTAILK